MNDPFSAATPTCSTALGLPGTRTFAVLGTLPAAPRLAVVGSRAALTVRVTAVHAIVDAARRAGMAIVSGGAIGIDAAAHRAALALGVPQIAVLPCGPDRPYPPDHTPLFQQIVAAGGALIFGRPRGAVPNRGVFASRNAIVVQLAQRLLVAQAASRSGSLATGRLALKAGKPVAVLSGQAATATLVDAGATPLALDPDQQALTAATQAWLADRTPAECPWPADLQPLREALRCAGPTGLSVDSLPPALVLAVVRAEGDGWVALRTGRYVAVR